MTPDPALSSGQSECYGQQVEPVILSAYNFVKLLNGSQQNSDFKVVVFVTDGSGGRNWQWNDNCVCCRQNW